MTIKPQKFNPKKLTREGLDNLLNNLNKMDRKSLENLVFGLCDIDIGKQELKARQAREDRNLFTETILKDRRTGQCIKQADIHKAIQYAFDNYKKVLVEISREHGKTTQGLSGLLWEIAKNKNILIKVVSASEAIAVKRVAAIKTHIESNAAFHELFPDVKPYINKFNIRDGWGTTKITVERDVIDPNVTCQSAGVLSTGVGDRADLIFFDDPCNLRNTVLFPALRDQVIQAYEQVWLPLFGAEGRQWYLATPWHNSDLTALLKKRWRDDPDACVLELHVGQSLDISSEGKIIDIVETNEKFLPIWPEQWNAEDLETRCSDMGSRSYDMAYRCRAMADDEITFKDVWLENAKDNTLSFTGNNLGLTAFMGVDLIAGSTNKNSKVKSGGSYFVIITVGVDESGNRRILNIYRERGLTFQNQVDAIKAEAQRYNPQTICIEDNAAQRWMVSHLTENTDLPIKGSTTTGNKWSPEQGVPAMAIEFENNKWILPYADERTQSVIDIMIGEFGSWPISATTDIVMATWLCYQAIKDGYVGELNYRYDPVNVGRDGRSRDLSGLF
ncbi:MAG: phage terminase large subunit family protein [Candidatus Anammoxibacter sp.]